MFPKPDADYAHHHDFLRAGEIPVMPYLGGPEDRLAHVYQSTIQLLVDIMRTPTFHDDLARSVGATGVVGGRDLLNRYVADTNRSLIVGANREIRPIVNLGAATARSELQTKLGLTKDLSSALAKPPSLSRRRSRSPHRRPAPLPPYRQLLRIPPNRMPNATRAIHGRHKGNVSQAYLNGVDLLTLSLVNNINDSQKDNIVQVLSDAVRKGDHIDRVSMQVANMVGLFPRWQRAVLNLQSRLNDAGVLTQSQIQQRVNDYADWLRERRGIMIARTELSRALNTGRLISWHEEAGRGWMDPKLSIKTWRAAPDACPACDELNGTEVKNIDNKFNTPFGWIVMPPAHPHCRCTVTLEPVGGSDPEEFENPDDSALLNNPENSQLLTAMNL
jgi:hypothetical protein